MLYHSNRMHDAVVSKLIATSRGSPCDSMASCLFCPRSVDKAGYAAVLMNNNYALK